MGPMLKGAGAIAFLLDYAFRGSPASFLLFAASDGALALLTLWALLRRQPSVRLMRTGHLRAGSDPGLSRPTPVGG